MSGSSSGTGSRTERSPSAKACARSDIAFRGRRLRLTMITVAATSAMIAASTPAAATRINRCTVARLDPVSKPITSPSGTRTSPPGPVTDSPDPARSRRMTVIAGRSGTWCG